MAGSVVDNGSGTTVTFQTSGFTSQVVSIDWGGIERPEIDVNHLGVAAPGAGEIGNGLFIPGDIVNPGELTLELHFDPDKTPPIHAVPEVITITFPLVAGDSTPAKWACQGFMKTYEPSIELEAKMTASATIKLTGNITLTAAA